MYTELKKQGMRRTRLKNAIMQHAAMFDMKYFMFPSPAETCKSKKPSFQMLNQCGTTCCIAGVAHVLWPTVYTQLLASKDTIWDTIKFDEEHLTALAAFLGFVESDCTDYSAAVADGSPVFWLDQWPTKIKSDYQSANQDGLFTKAAQCACAAIDHFTERLSLPNE